MSEKSAFQSLMEKRQKKRLRLRDQPLAIQFLLAGAIVAGFLVLSLFYLYSQVGHQTRITLLAARAHQKIGELGQLEKEFVNQQTSLRNFLAKKGSGVPEELKKQKEAWLTRLETIKRLTEGQPGENKLANQIEENYDAWFLIAEEMMAERKINPSLYREEGNVFNEASLYIGQLARAQTELLQQYDWNEQVSIRSIFATVSGLSLLLLIIFGIVLTRLYFSIARPINDLSKVIQKYRKGDFTARVTTSSHSQIGYLESSFNELAEKIEDMIEDLKKLDVLKSEFLSMVSHELRTPLTSIGGYVKLLISGDSGPVTRTQTEFLNIIDTNVVRLTNLINDILDVEKIESGKIQLLKEPQDLASILTECRDTFDILAKQKGIELKYSVPPDSILVKGDRSRLIQVFMNLISNAIKYTEQGFVEISAELKDYAVTVRIKDSGIGLTKEDKEKLFRKFYRSRGALSSKEGGTGLGLVIVKGLVEAHDGKITVESETGEGTTFVVSLPVESMVSAILSDPQGAPLKIQPVPQPAQAELRKMIWVLDKNQDDANKMKEMLEAGELFPGQEIQVQQFSNHEDLPEIDNPIKAPVLVIIDIETGGGEHEIIPEVRRRLRQTIPLLAVGNNVDPVAAFAEGASALLAKPFRRSRFIAAVKNLVSAKGWRILIADSNTDIRLLFKRSLEQRGFKVDDVYSGNMVLGRLDQEAYDLALVETSFPDISGLELMKIIRSKDRFKDLPVFLMDEEKDAPTIEELKNSGADRFIAKDRGIDNIVDSVCQFLEDKKFLEQHH